MFLPKVEGMDNHFHSEYDRNNNKIYIQANVPAKGVNNETCCVQHDITSTGNGGHVTNNETSYIVHSIASREGGAVASLNNETFDIQHNNNQENFITHAADNMEVNISRNSGWVTNVPVKTMYNFPTTELELVAGDGDTGVEVAMGNKKEWSKTQIKKFQNDIHTGNVPENTNSIKTSMVGPEIKSKEGVQTEHYDENKHHKQCNFTENNNNIDGYITENNGVDESYKRYDSMHSEGHTEKDVNLSTKKPDVDTNEISISNYMGHVQHAIEKAFNIDHKSAFFSKENIVECDSRFNVTNIRPIDHPKSEAEQISYSNSHRITEDGSIGKKVQQDFTIPSIHGGHPKNGEEKVLINQTGDSSNGIHCENCSANHLEQIQSTRREYCIDEDTDSISGGQAVNIRHGLGNKLHFCTYCGMAYCRKIELDMHLLTHSFNSPSMATYCHHNVADLITKCPCCSKGFCRWDDLVSHMDKDSDFTCTKKYNSLICIASERAPEYSPATPTNDDLVGSPNHEPRQNITESVAEESEDSNSKIDVEQKRSFKLERQLTIVKKFKEYREKLTNISQSVSTICAEEKKGERIQEFEHVKRGRPRKCTIQRKQNSAKTESETKNYFKIRASLVKVLKKQGREFHQCRECGRLFNTQSNLSMHMRIHNDERPFCCTKCSASFRQRCHLQVHSRRHTNERPFICKHCGESFKQSSGLKYHERNSCF